MQAEPSFRTLAWFDSVGNNQKMKAPNQTAVFIFNQSRTFSETNWFDGAARPVTVVSVGSTQPLKHAGCAARVTLCRATLTGSPEG